MNTKPNAQTKLIEKHLKKAERDEYRYNLSCARNEIHNMQLSMTEDINNITEKDAEIAELEERIADGDKDFAMANSQNERLLKFVRHHKHKRCLAIAMWCAAECIVNKNNYKGFQTHKSKFRIGHYQKWYFRWLAIAEKFEEA